MEVHQFPYPFGKKIQYSDLFFLILFLAFIISYFKTRMEWVKTYLYIPICLYFLMHVFSMFNSTSVLKSLLEITGVIYLIAIFFLVNNLVNNRDILHKVLISWMLALGIVLICGLIGLAEVYIFQKESSLFMLSYPAPERHKLIHRMIPRVISTLRSPDMLMSYFVVSAGLLIGFFESTENKKIKTSIITLLGLLLFVALFTTSRGVLALLVCFFIATAVFKERKNLCLIMTRYLLIIMIAGFFSLFIILTIWAPSKIAVSDSAIAGERNLSIDFHRTNKFYYYKYALSMIKEHPFIGIGSGNFNKSLKEYYFKNPKRDPYFKDFITYDPHSTFFGLGAETGLIGLISFFGIILLFLKYMFDIYKNSEDRYMANIALGIMASVIGILVQAITMDVQNLRFLWFVLGLGIALKNISQNNNLTESRYTYG